MSAIALLQAGCGAPSEPVGTNSLAIASPAAQPRPEPIEGDELKARLDKTLEEVFERRTLNLERNAAWQILHGVLAYRMECLMETGDSESPMKPVVAHLLGGGEMRGWDVHPGVSFDNGRRGLRVAMDVGSKAGQGHPDQWFAILAQCGLPPTQKVMLKGQEYMLADMLQQIQFEVPRNETAEYSWTLIGVTTYYPTTVSWQAIDGETWSVERLVEIELEHELDSSACGGTHRLIGLAMARNRRAVDQDPLDGIWATVEQRLADAVERAKSLQNPDGSFSTHYFARPSTSPDLAQNLGATGHILEYLTIALKREQLDEAWVRHSVEYICDLLERTRDLPLECGALYHAVHGLVLYRERVYGPRRFGKPETPAATTPDAKDAPSDVKDAPADAADAVDRGKTPPDAADGADAISEPQA
ncbi:MAG: hypothetical protein KDB14_20540 [Planctomycetales bacterium]|nr:hypothetical protein [Planctomycetales bacterium]